MLENKCLLAAFVSLPSRQIFYKKKLHAAKFSECGSFQSIPAAESKQSAST